MHVLILLYQYINEYGNTKDSIYHHNTKHLNVDTLKEYINLYKIDDTFNVSTTNLY